MKAFGVLARLRRFRGTSFDLFGRTEERRTERALIGEYETTLAEILAKLTPQNHATAVDLASVPEHIRGYGHVRRAHLTTAKARESALLAQFRSPQAPPEPVAIRMAV